MGLAGTRMCSGKRHRVHARVVHILDVQVPQMVDAVPVTDRILREL